MIETAAAWVSLETYEEDRVLKDKIAQMRDILNSMENGMKVQALCFYIIVEDGREIGGTEEEVIFTSEYGRLDAVRYLVGSAQNHLDEAALASL